MRGTQFQNHFRGMRFNTIFRKNRVFIVQREYKIWAAIYIWFALEWQIFCLDGIRKIYIEGVRYFHNRSVSEKVDASFPLNSKQKHWYLRAHRSKNVRFEVCYVRTHSITAVRRKFQTKHQNTLSAGTIMLRCVEYINNLGIVKIRTAQERPPVCHQTVQTINSSSSWMQEGPWEERLRVESFFNLLCRTAWKSQFTFFDTK